jgi:hypothetical protein
MNLSDIVRGVPLIGCVAVVYAVLAVSGADMPAQRLVAITLPSGDLWTFATADLLLLLSVIALYFEVLKATRTSQASVVDHILSLFAFVLCLVGFLLVPSLGTSTFLLISVMAMFDVIAGFTITITSARRDFAYTVDRP